MTEEIKEIFYKLKSDDYYEEHYQQSVYYERDLKKLENYITNLQKENLKLISENEAIKSIKYTVDETIYKSRNEKAVEYIKNTIFWGLYEDVPMIDTKYGGELENILQGGD